MAILETYLPTYDTTVVLPLRAKRSPGHTGRRVNGATGSTTLGASGGPDQHQPKSPKEQRGKVTGGCIVPVLGIVGLGVLAYAGLGWSRNVPVERNVELASNPQVMTRHLLAILGIPDDKLAQVDRYLGPTARKSVNELAIAATDGSLSGFDLVNYRNFMTVLERIHSDKEGVKADLEAYLNEVIDDPNVHEEYKVGLREDRALLLAAIDAYEPVELPPGLSDKERARRMTESFVDQMAQHNFTDMCSVQVIRRGLEAYTTGQGGSYLPVDLPDCYVTGQQDSYRARMLEVRVERARQRNLNEVGTRSNAALRRKLA